MPTFLSDPTDTQYLLLALALLIAGGVWFNRRDRKSARAFAVVAGVAAALLLLDFLIRSPRESAVRTVEALSAAANARNWDDFDKLVSKDFEHKGLKKADLKGKLAAVIGMFDARTAVWGFDRDKVRQTADDRIEVVFDVKVDPKTGAAYYGHFKSGLVREADGEWRLKSLAIYSYTSKTNGPEEPLPGLP